MNTNAIAHAPAVQGHGRPDKAEKAGKTMEAETQSVTATAVEITLSQDAQAAMTENGVLQGPGKSANSPAHQARALLAEGRLGGDYKNFGQLVSSIARGLDVTGEDGEGEDGTVEAPADGGEAPVAETPDDAAEPAMPIPDDAVAAPVEESAEDEVGEEIVQPAEETVAEETTAEDPGTPVAEAVVDPVIDPAIDPAIDPVAVEDELLEALDDTVSEET